jgi:hypothetical protein
MSVSEINAPRIHTASFTLAAGAAAPAIVPNFDGTCKVLSIERIGAATGPAGVPAASVQPPAGTGDPGARWRLGVYSSVNTDTSTYVVTWARFYRASSAYVQGGTPEAPVAFVAGQQYA